MSGWWKFFVWWQAQQTSSAISFRIAEITPILKKSTLDPAIPGNYRPISNLQFISKVLERVVNEQLMLHLRINDLLPEHQSAYRSCHSTESVLLKVTSDALLAANQGKLTLLGMLDMSARVRLRRPYHPHSSIKCILRHWRKCTRLDRFVYRRKETVRTLQWSDIKHIRGRMRGASRLGARTTLFRPFYSRCIRYRWWARLLHSRIRRWHADLRPLLRWRHEPPHIQACRLHR